MGTGNAPTAEPTRQLTGKELMGGRLLRYIDERWGRADYTSLPRRVRYRVRQQQNQSEILIGWVQLGVVLTFGVLYAIAPKTFAEDAAFEPVPWALSAYLGFTVIRLLLAYQKRLTDPILYLSIVVDMTLLYGLIWSFHIQYVQPPSFYLKVPTLLYVFIFVALRTLHFEVRFVATAGVVAALGWLAMVWYVVSSEPGNPMITRDYVEYMTSNSILLGAEFDKIISILVVTAILALAIARARHLMIRSIIDSTTASDLSRFVPTEVAQQVATSADAVEAGQGEVREATIFFIDLADFTAIGEGLSPERLIATMNEYFTVVSKPIAKYGGVINQFQGDAILASFNLPKPHEDHAANAVRAALEIDRTLDTHTFNLGIQLMARIGINSGEVVGGLVGTRDRLSYTVHGDAVNLAARLEQLNKEYRTRILVSERTVALAGGHAFAFRRVGESRVRGRSRPTVLYTVDDGEQRPL